MSCRLSRSADHDLDRIYEAGLMRFGRERARRYVKDVHRSMDRIAAFPRSARERTEFDPPVRVQPVGVHLIVYRIEGEDVFVLRIRHGHEDWQAG